MRYLVTGGAGFIGSHLVDALLERGHSVRVLDNFATGHRRNLAHVERDIELIEGDIRDAETLGRAMDGVQRVLHQAALPSVPRSLADPMATHQVNATGTLNVLVSAKKHGVQRVVVASSSSVYGDTPTLPKDESLPMKPFSPYASSKAAAEMYCNNFQALFGIETVILRYFNVFGPRQDPKGAYAAVIPAFISAVLEARSPTVRGDGKQTRDFTFVSNVVEANLLSAEVPAAAGKTMNVGGGGRTSLIQLLDSLSKLTGKSIEPTFEPRASGDVLDSQASIERARTILNYQPKVAVEEGLARILKSLQG